MRRMFLIALSSCALLAITPATALARHSSRHRRAHHARVHHKRFGTDPASPTTPTTTPTMTVMSFDTTTNVLMISTSTGTVSGTVTPDTRLVCIPPQPTGTMQPFGEDQNHDSGPGGSGWGGGGDWGGGDNSQGGDDFNQMCSTTDLTAGTLVKFADLSLSSNGNNWDTVVLVTQPSTVPTVPDTDNDGD